MIKKPNLSHLARRAAEDGREGPAFFRALLNSEVYSHVPIDDPVTRNLRFTLFNHPETGQQLLPFFTDRRKAEFAAARVRRIVKIPGRQFLEATLGATLMVNPNDERGTLYPEEVRQLLLTGKVARVETFELQQKGELLVGPLDPIPAWLTDAVAAALSPLAFVDIAYIAAVHPRDPNDHKRAIVALGTLDGFGERAIRAFITALQPELVRRNFPLEGMHFKEPDDRPPWVKNLQLPPIYQRAKGAPSHTSTSGCSASVN